jgi:hypothetical protein
MSRGRSGLGPRPGSGRRNEKKKFAAQPIVSGLRTSAQNPEKTRRIKLKENKWPKSAEMVLL